MNNIKYGTIFLKMNFNLMQCIVSCIDRNRKTKNVGFVKAVKLFFYVICLKIFTSEIKLQNQFNI